MDPELRGQRFNWRDDMAEGSARKHGVTFVEATHVITS